MSALSREPYPIKRNDVEAISDFEHAAALCAPRLVPELPCTAGLEFSFCNILRGLKKPPALALRNDARVHDSLSESSDYCISWLVLPHKDLGIVMFALEPYYICIFRGRIHHQFFHPKYRLLPPSCIGLKTYSVAILMLWYWHYTS